MTEYPTQSDLQSCADLAAHYKWDFDIVLSAFKKHKVAEAVDGLDKQTLDEDIECLKRALNYARKTVECLSNLSEISTEKQEITGDRISLDAEILGRKLERVFEQHKNIRRVNSTKGGLNYKALYIARMVADIINELGRKITFGKSPEGEPTTEFCQAVRTALIYFDVKTTQVNRDRKSLDRELPIADWQGPCERVWKEWESKG